MALSEATDPFRNQIRSCPRGMWADKQNVLCTLRDTPGSPEAEATDSSRLWETAHGPAEREATVTLETALPWVKWSCFSARSQHPQGATLPGEGSTPV